MVINRQSLKSVVGIALCLLLALNSFVMAVQYCPMKTAPAVTAAPETGHACCADKVAEKTKPRPKHCSGECCKSCKILFHAASAVQLQKWTPDIPIQDIFVKKPDLSDLTYRVMQAPSVFESPPGSSIPVFTPLRI